MKESVKVEQKEEVKKHKPATKKELKKLCSNEEISLGDIDTSLITDMSEIFQWSFRKDFSGIETWDTSNVTNMANMFASCYYFNQPLNFDTSNVTNMSRMFNDCTNFNQALKFDTSKVTDMSEMFRACINFNQTLNFNTSNVTNMKCMFEKCSSLECKPNFDMSNVKNKLGMFYGCTEPSGSGTTALKELMEKINDYLGYESNVIGVAVLNPDDIDESDLELDDDMEISDFVWDNYCVNGFELDDDSISLDSGEFIQLALHEKTYSSGEYVVAYTREKANSYNNDNMLPCLDEFNPKLLVGYAYSFTDELGIPANYILKGFVYLDEDVFKYYCEGIDEKVLKEVLKNKSLDEIDEDARAYIFMRLFEKTGKEPYPELTSYCAEDVIDTSIQTVNI